MPPELRSANEGDVSGLLTARFAHAIELRKAFACGSLEKSRAFCAAVEISLRKRKDMIRVSNSNDGIGSYHRIARQANRTAFSFFALAMVTLVSLERRVVIFE